MFSESTWCQLSQIQRQRQIKGNRRHLWCDKLLKGRWQKDSEYDTQQAGSRKYDYKYKNNRQTYDVICFWKGDDKRGLIVKKMQNMHDLQNMQNMKNMQNSQIMENRQKMCRICKISKTCKIFLLWIFSSVSFSVNHLINQNATKSNVPIQSRGPVQPKNLV